jgi:hypothetical protein
VATDGSYAWHDHRAHWMNPAARPLGAEPGDVILQGVIPIVVDNAEVEVSVESRWLDPPSPVPLIAGLVLALAAVAVLVFVVPSLASGRSSPAQAGRGVGAALGLTALWAVPAVAVGAGATLGLPGEAAPGVTFWLLPLLAALAAVGGLVLVRRSGPDGLPSLAGPALLALAGLELLVWFWLRRPALTRALVPTEAPVWLDRAVVAGAVVIGLSALVVAVRTLLAPVAPVPARSTPPG